MMLQDDIPVDLEQQSVVRPVILRQNMNSSATSVSLPASHPLNDMDFSQHAPCGKFKCFFQSVHQKDVGYLVGESIMWRMKKGWDYGKHLQDQYNIKHFMLEPPKSFKKGKSEFVEKLNNAAYRVGGERIQDFTPFCSSTDNPNPSCESLVIQKVRKVPNSTFFVGCGGGQGKKRNATLDDWKTSSWADTVKDKAAFVNTLDLEIQSLSKLMEQEPLFLYDFQLFLDRTGVLYHLDFDRITQGQQLKKKIGERAFQKWAKFVKDSCIDLLQTLKGSALRS